MSKESEKVSEEDKILSDALEKNIFVEDDACLVEIPSLPIFPYEELREKTETTYLQTEENNDKLTQEVNELEIQDKSCFSSPIFPTENYREAFSQVVAKSKKSNKFSVRMSETWRDGMAKEERVLQLRKTWKLKKMR